MNPELERELNLLAKAIDQRHDKSGWTGIQSAYLTRGDGTGTLMVANGNPREIWCYRDDRQAPFAVYLPVDANLTPLRDGDVVLEQIEVRIGFPPDSLQLTVMDNNTTGGRASVGALSPMEAINYGAYYSSAERITTLRAAPTDPASQSIQVSGPWPYLRPSTGGLQLYTGDTSALGTTIAAKIAALAAGKHQLQLIYFDKETGSLGTASNTAATAVATLPAPDEFVFADVQSITLSPNWTPIIVIYTYYGQSVVSEAEFYRGWDLRLLFAVPRVGALFAQTATATVANTVTQTTLVSTGVGSVTLPADYLVAGKTLRVRASGFLSDTGTPNLTMRVKFGTTVIASTGAVALNGTISNNVWLLECDITCRAAGASGTVFGQGKFFFDNSAQTGKTEGMVNTATVTIDTTAAQAISVTAEWDAASASNTISATNLTVEAVN
jgi:hypothetical protein